MVGAERGPTDPVEERGGPGVGVLCSTQVRAGSLTCLSSSKKAPRSTTFPLDTQVSIGLESQWVSASSRACLCRGWVSCAVITG